MKIEKINDNRLKCSITTDDLVEREITVEEVVDKTHRAKRLFTDAFVKSLRMFGSKPDCLVVATAVTPSSETVATLTLIGVDSDDEGLSILSKNLQEVKAEAPPETEFNFQTFSRSKKSKESSPQPYFDQNQAPQHQHEESLSDDFISFVYAFPNLQRIIDVASAHGATLEIESDIYKDKDKGDYFLILKKKEPDDFKRACILLCEYGEPLGPGDFFLSYMYEHCLPILQNNALKDLSSF